MGREGERARGREGDEEKQQTQFFPNNLLSVAPSHVAPSLRHSVTPSPARPLSPSLGAP